MSFSSSGRSSTDFGVGTTYCGMPGFREAFEHWSRVSRTSCWDVQLWPRQYSLQRQPSTRTSQIFVLFLFSFHRLLRFLDLRLCALRLRRDLRRFALFFSAQRRRGGFSLLLLLQKRLHRGLLFLFGFLLGYLRDFAMRQRPWNGWIPNRPARWWLFRSCSCPSSTFTSTSIVAFSFSSASFFSCCNRNCLNASIVA